MSLACLHHVNVWTFEEIFTFCCPNKPDCARFLYFGHSGFISHSSRHSFIGSFQAKSIAVVIRAPSNVDGKVRWFSLLMSPSAVIDTFLRRTGVHMAVQVLLKDIDSRRFAKWEIKYFWVSKVGETFVGRSTKGLSSVPKISW